VTPETLVDIFDKYHQEARRLQRKYADSISLLVGFEIDWIRPASQTWIEQLLTRHQWDLFIGSVHHVHGIPIDYDGPMYERARCRSHRNAVAAGIPAEDEEMLFADYYDAQYAMLQALRPPIVGHFDLIRLLSREPQQSPKYYSRVWRKILRNLLFVKEYGGVLELNTAAVRKGLTDPYPHHEIAKVGQNTPYCLVATNRIL
jgi:histidinol-phosphatase (PHP family)